MLSWSATLTKVKQIVKAAISDQDKLLQPSTLQCLALHYNWRCCSGAQFLDYMMRQLLTLCLCGRQTYTGLGMKAREGKCILTAEQLIRKPTKKLKLFWFFLMIGFLQNPKLPLKPRMFGAPQSQFRGNYRNDTKYNPGFGTQNLKKSLPMTSKCVMVESWVVVLQSFFCWNKASFLLSRMTDAEKGLNTLALKTL